MEYIAHRVNTREDLKHLPQEYGVEIDVRDYTGRLILQHDPFMNGEDFEKYLQAYQHGTMILNIKSERIEWKVKELLKQYGIDKYFFLDSSFGMIYSLLQSGEKNVAVRFSEIEALETVLALQGQAEWVWVDCFTKLPLNAVDFQILKQCGFKICLTSPDLLGRTEEIKKYKAFLEKENITCDAICTKVYNIPQWKSS